MDNKIFDLLEKVYIDLQETKSDVKEIKQEQIKTNARLSRLEIKVEHEISNKIDALFEFRDEAMQRFDRIEGKIDDLSEKVDKHEIKIQVIEGGKKKKSL